MCKFTNRLFVFVLLESLTVGTLAKPVKVRSSAGDLLELLYNDYGDYGYQVEEIHYDQRQKGQENLKLRLDGFLIGLPAYDDVSWMDLLAEEYLTNALPKKQISPETGQNYHMVTENIAAESATAHVVNIPSSKKDIESRQRASEEISSAPRTKSHMLQILQMLRRAQT